MLTGLPSWLQFILIMGALIALVHVTARWVGLGRCIDCGRGCAYWDARCRAHHPDNPTNRTERR